MDCDIAVCGGTLGLLVALALQVSLDASLHTSILGSAHDTGASCRRVVSQTRAPHLHHHYTNGNNGSLGVIVWVI